MMVLSKHTYKTYVDNNTDNQHNSSLQSDYIDQLLFGNLNVLSGKNKTWVEENVLGHNDWSYDLGESITLREFKNEPIQDFLVIWLGDEEDYN